MNKFTVISFEEGFTIEGQGKAGRKVPMRYVIDCEINDGVQTLTVADFQDSFSFWWTEDAEELAIANAFGIATSGSSGISFKRCRRLHISASVLSIDPNIFSNMNLSEISLSDDNPNFCVSGGVLYTKDMKKLIYCPKIDDAIDFNVPQDTTIIGESSFWNNRIIKKITLNNVKCIEKAAFSFSSVEEVLGGDKVELVCEKAFYYCSSLVKAEISIGASTEENAFGDCNKLEVCSMEKRNPS